MAFVLSENIGRQFDYITETQPGSRNNVKVSVICEPKIADDLLSRTDLKLFKELFQDNETILNGKTYEWIGISSIIQSDQPCCWVLSYEDFYTLEQYDSRDIACGTCNSFNYKVANFSITFKGDTYNDCRMVLIINHPQINTNDGFSEINVNVFYRVPIGYDGCVLGFHNSSALTKEQIKKGMSNPAASLGIIQRADGDLYIRLK